MLDLKQIEFEISGITGADTDLLKKEQIDELRHAMDMIKDEYREVLYLLYFEDMKYEEAGRIMGKSVSQITNLAHRAKKSIKKLLEKEGFTSEYR